MKLSVKFFEQQWKARRISTACSCFLTLRILKQGTITHSMNFKATYEMKLVPTRNAPQSPKLVEENVIE